jgi:hypothetical protein
VIIVRMQLKVDKFKSQAFEDYMLGQTKAKPSDACQ